MIELTLANGKELDLPAGSIVLAEEMEKTTNPNFPDARCFIRYLIDGDLRIAILNTKLEDVMFEIGCNDNPRGWLKLTRKSDNRRLVLRTSLVVSRMALDEGCEISLSYGQGSKPETIQVNESRREIKKWSEGDINGQAPE